MNIATPSRAGVSVNQFADYNVPDTGVIMNNSQTIARSELGALSMPITNWWMVDQPVWVVFQVTGVGPSALMGYSEMHGDSADFILTNPNGISINGGGFIARLG